jgi:putative FmdB family regulatory protein
MPIYEYHCQQCNERFDGFKKLVDSDQPQAHTCGTVSQKVISKPMIAIDYPAYESPATGRWVEGKKAHLEELKRTGCRILEPGESKDMEGRLKANEAKLDNFIDTSVEKVFAELKG